MLPPGLEVAEVMRRARDIDVAMEGLSEAEARAALQVEYQRRVHQGKKLPLAEAVQLHEHRKETLQALEVILVGVAEGRAAAVPLCAQSGCSQRLRVMMKMATQSVTRDVVPEPDPFAVEVAPDPVPVLPGPLLLGPPVRWDVMYGPLSSPYCSVRSPVWRRPGQR